MESWDIQNDHGALSEGMVEVQDTYNESYSALDDDHSQRETAKVEIKKLHWTDAATKLLLSFLKETRPKLGKYAAIRNKTKMWCYLASEMGKRGYMYTPIQVENKFRSLERMYKKDKEKGKRNCYYSDLEELFEDNEEKINLNLNEESEDTELHMDVEETKNEDTVNPQKLRPLRCSQRDMQKTLLKIALERKKYHDKVLYYLKKKDAREQKREERAERKLQLMELFIKNFR